MDPSDPSERILRLSVSPNHLWRCFSYKPIDKNSKEWRDLRGQTLERYNYTCRFCGVRAYKYMVCDHLDRDQSNNSPSNLGISCLLCNAIRYCGINGLNGLLCLAISKMPQKDINFKTLQLYNQTRRVPKVTEVDSEAIMIASSTAAYANKLLDFHEGPGYLNYNSQCRCHPVYHTYSMHKGFFKEAAADRMENIVKHSSIPPLETKK